jgi:hypothetical protein
MSSSPRPRVVKLSVAKCCSMCAWYGRHDAGGMDPEQPGALLVRLAPTQHVLPHPAQDAGSQ